MKKVISLIFILCLGINIFAQMGGSAPSLSAEKGMIKGSVKETSQKTALEYANVLVYSLPDSSMVSGTITNPQGSFEIKDLSYGKYYIIAEFIGFKKKTIPDLEISKENKVIDCGEIVLEPSVTELSEVNVTAEKNMVMYQIDKKVVNIDKKLTAAGGNLVDALENTPSIQVDAEGNVTLRGSSNFTVLIDGKPTALAGNDALKQIPSSAVANIEIITNPSAKYDPDGSAGIINIIMKKEYKKGMNGIVNASAGNYFQHNGDFNLNFRQEKVNFFVGGSYSDRRRHPSTSIKNEQHYTDQSYYTTQNSDRDQNNKSWSLKGGIDFYLNQNSTLTASGEYGYFGFDMLMPAKSTKTSLPLNEILYYVNKSHLTIGGKYTNLNLNYEQKFNEKGHKVLLGMNYSNWDGKVTSDIQIDTTTVNWSDVLSANRYRTIQKNLEKEYRGKIDYTYPVNDKINLEAGYQARIENVTSTYQKEDYVFITNGWDGDANFNNGMEFKQNIHSLYFTVSGSLIGIDAKAGLRGEYFDRFLKINSPSDNYKLELFELVPTLHLSKKLGQKHQIQASYSRRINRPEQWNLNPFPIYTDNDITQTGNPDLKPEYVDSYEINFMRNLKKGFVSVETYYKQTNNAINQTLIKDPETNLIKISPDNLDRNFSYGMNFSTNLSLVKWFSVYASANIYSFNVSGDIVSADIDTKRINSDFVLNSNFNFKKGTRFQLTGFYNAPKLTSQGEQSEMYGINMALRQDFLKKKLAVSLRVNDVFSTMKFRFNSYTPASGSGIDEIPEVKTDFTFKMDSPTVMLSLSYTINNYKKRAEEEGPQQNVGGGGIF